MPQGSLLCQAAPVTLNQWERAGYFIYVKIHVYEYDCYYDQNCESNFQCQYWQIIKFIQKYWYSWGVWHFPTRFYTYMWLTIQL